MEKIYFSKTLIAIRVNQFHQGTTPLSDTRQPLQFLTHKHTKGTLVKAHFHVPKKRITDRLQECLIVKSGKIKVYLYTPEKKLIKHLYLTFGQSLILISGGWAIQVITESEFIEVKNGPFIEDTVFL